LESWSIENALFPTIQNSEHSGTPIHKHCLLTPGFWLLTTGFEREGGFDSERLYDFILNTEY